MALDLSTLRRPANPQVVDPSTGRMREDWQLYFDQLTTRINASVGALATDPAPANAQYIVAATDSTLSAERVATNTATVEWDFATAGQAKANVPADAFGDVVGPASATDNAVALFDGTTGTLLQDSQVTISDSGNVVVNSTEPSLTLRGTSGNPSIEMGRVDGGTSSPFIDFHSGATLVDYDARIMATGGSGVIGGGTLHIVAGALQQNGVALLKTGDATPAWAYATEVTTTGAVAFALASGLPSTVQEIEIMLRGVSTNSANQEAILQLGDSVGFETAGYVSGSEGNAVYDGQTNGFLLAVGAGFDAATTLSGTIRLTRYNNNAAAWNMFGITDGNIIVNSCAGYKTLAGVLTQVRLTTSGGAATFDAGTVSLRYR